MGTPIRVNEDNYIHLQQMAAVEGRTPTNMLNRILDERFGRSTHAPTVFGTAHGTPIEITPTPKNTNEPNPEPVYMKLGGTPPSAYVEDLIKGGQLQRGVDETKIVRKIKTRTKGDILKDIRDLEAERDEAMQWCQDREERAKISATYSTPIDSLWIEFRELDNA